MATQEWLATEEETQERDSTRERLAELERRIAELEEFLQEVAEDTLERRIA